MHNSYHDVVVAANNRLYEIFNLPFSVSLTATRAAGWELWNGANCLNGNEDEKIAEEYGSAPMALYVKHDDKTLKPTQFCHHNWTTPKIDLELSSEPAIMIGNMPATANYKGRGNLEITASEYLLGLLKAYVVFTESIFYDDLMWEVQSYTASGETLLLQIANPKYNKDL